MVVSIQMFVNPGTPYSSRPAAAAGVTRAWLRSACSAAAAAAVLLSPAVLPAGPAGSARPGQQHQLGRSQPSARSQPAVARTRCRQTLQRVEGRLSGGQDGEGGRSRDPVCNSNFIVYLCGLGIIQRFRNAIEITS